MLVVPNNFSSLLAMSASGAPSRRYRGKRAGRQVIQRALRTAIRGKAFTPTPDVPAFTQLPWWRLILSDEPMTVSSEKLFIKNYTPKDLHAIFQAQTGITIPPESISFRVQSVRAWCRSTSVLLTLQCYDLSVGFGAYDTLSQTEDAPGAMQFARLGYTWPASQQLIAVSGHDDEKIVSISTSSANKCIVRFELLWKPRFLEGPNRTNLLSRVRQLETSMASAVLVDH